MILLLLACIDAPRRPLGFPIRYEPITTEVAVPGGTLALEQATLEISDLHLQEAPDTSARWTFSWASSALAHPGHEFAGSVRGELIGEWDLDLFVPTELGEAEAYEGSIATGSVLLDNSRWHLRGQFVGEAGALPVDLDLTVSSVVTNLPVVLELDADAPPAALALHLDLAHALSFSVWEDVDGDGTIRVDDGPLTNTLTFGLTSTASWSIEETP